MFDRPHLPGAVEAHLNLVVHDQNAVASTYCRHSFEVVARRDDITPRPLHWFDEECAELGATRLWIPRTRVFVLEETLEFVHTEILCLLRVTREGRSEDVRIGQELG